MLEQLEKLYGPALLWEWVKDWIQNEKECDDDERSTLEEYLLLRAGNYDEDFGLDKTTESPK